MFPKDRFKVSYDQLLMLKAVKADKIESFNNEVKRGASTSYLNSLYRQVRWEITDINRQLGFLPKDGYSMLRTDWIDKETD